MKRFLLVLLVFMLAFGLFADDAKVLPKGIFRFYLAPSYASGSESFDADGEKVDFTTVNGEESSYSFFNLGLALEYGVNDFISAAVQWAPGINLSSTFDGLDEQNSTGLFEIFAGAKIQIIGPMAPVENDMIRLAVAPGVMIPMAFGYDAEAELENMTATLTYLGSGGYFGEMTDFNADPANSAFGLGFRFYADYVINDMIFLNLYSEYIKYLEKDAENDLGGLAAGADTVNYGYKLTGELDVNFSKPLTDGLILSGGLPVVYTTSPEVVYDDAEADSDNASYTLAVNPDVSLFVTSLPLPLEFKVSYKVPLMGQNDMAMNTLTAQVKAYFKF